MNIIKSKIKKNEEVELGFRTGLISEFIEIMKRLPYNELRKDVVLVINRIIELGNADHTNRIFEKGIIQYLEPKLKDDDKNSRGIILFTFIDIIKKGWK